jgi:hypothetical protein
MKAGRRGTERARSKVEKKMSSTVPIVFVPVCSCTQALCGTSQEQEGKYDGKRREEKSSVASSSSSLFLTYAMPISVPSPTLLPHQYSSQSPKYSLSSVRSLPGAGEVE